MNRNSLRPSLDAGLLLVLALTLFLALPLAQWPGLTIAPEWLPDGAAGAVLLLCFALCSGGMYLFCKRRSGRLGALIAGLVYVYSPALMHSAAFARGAYAELLALALFPLLLWRIDVLRDKPQPISFLLVCLLQAALLHTQLSTALALAGIAFAWLLFETLIQRFNREASQLRASSGALAALAVVLGALAAATAWLPIAQAGVSAGPDYRGGFLTLQALLWPPPIQDAGAINGLRELPILGPAQWTLAGVGMLAALGLYVSGYRTRHPQAFLGTAFFAALALLLIVLMLPAAAGLWERWPLLPGLGSPARLLGPTAACLAIVASMNGLWLGLLQARYQSRMIAIVVALPLLTAIPLLYLPGAQPALETTARQHNAAPGPISGLVSAAAILLAIAAALRLRRWQLTPRPYWTTAPLSRTTVVGILLGGAIALLSLLITYREGVAWLNSPPGQALPAQVQRVYSLGDNLRLLGYDLNADAFRAGERLLFNAYWYALERPAVDYSSFLLVAAEGQVAALAAKLHPAGRPTSEAWGPDGYVLDRYDLLLPADLAHGEYDVIVHLAVCGALPLDECAADVRSADASSDDSALAGSAVITTLRVEAR